MIHSKTGLVLALLVAKTSFAQVAVSNFTADTTRAQRYFKQGLNFTKAAEYDSANLYFEAARQIFERYAAQRHDSTLWKCDVLCYNFIGDNLRVKGEYKAALTILHKNLALARRKIGETNSYVVDIYNHLGAVYGEQANYDRAISFNLKSLALARQLFGEESATVARSYNNLANAIGDKGDLEKASEYYAKALRLRRKLLGDDHPRVATTYLNMGTVYDLAGDGDKALDCFNRALAIWKSKLGEIHPNVALAHLNVGSVYFTQGDYNAALAEHRQALEIYKHVHGDSSLDAGDSYGNIGNDYLGLGQYREAIAFMERALDILRREVGENHPLVATRYSNIGDAYYQQGDFERALDFFQKDLAIQQQLHHQKHWDTAQAYQELGRVKLAKNDFTAALRYCQKALFELVPNFADSNIFRNPSLRSSISEVVLLSSLALKAEAMAKRYTVQSRDRQDLLLALATCQLASDLIEKMRVGYRSEGSKLALGKQAVRVYEQALSTSLRLYELTHAPQDQQQAFAFVEKSKAGVLLEALQESRAKNFAGIPPDLLENEKDLRVDLAFYETAIQEEKLITADRDNAKLRELESRRFARRREYDNLIARLEKSYPQYYALKYKTQTATVPELQKTLDDQTAVVEYFLGDSAIYAFTVTRRNFQALTLPKDSAFSITATILAQSFRNVSSKPEYLTSAAQLYDWLIKPLAPFIAAKPKWVIIPGGELYQIPFEALLAEAVPPNSSDDYNALPYLLKQREISYHYSATLFLKALQQKPATNYINTFAGFAPVFSSATQNGKLLVLNPAELLSFNSAPSDKTSYQGLRGDELVELKFSAQEVQSILALLGGHGQVFLNQAASEENFKEKSNGYKYVHLATHGFINSGNPQLSRLAFSQPQEQNTGDDGFLYSGETYNLQLNADLLTLSSCESGIGKLAKGEGVIALTRGFLYSGARNIVASLWKVYDQHTSLLMVEMYRQISIGKSYSAALREAKLKMIANPETAGPQSWASFVLIGR